MPNPLTGTYSITGGAAVNLLTFLTTNGFNGFPKLTRLLLKPAAENLYIGSASNVNASTGTPIDQTGYLFEGDGLSKFDAVSRYIFSINTQNVGVDAEAG